MSMHLAAYTESQDSAALVNVAAVNDQVLTPSGGDGLVIPGDYNAVHAVAALGSDLTRAKLVAPSLDVKRINFEIIPHERGADSFTLAAPKIMRPIGPVVLDPGEVLTAQAAEDNAAADRSTVLVWLKKPGELPQMPAGDVRIVRWTGATALTANVWTDVPVTLDQDLPAGEYALVGIFARSATAQAVRAIIPGQIVRPGVPAIAAASEAAARFHNPLALRDFGGYEMGRFTNRQIPTLQFLATAADAAQDGEFYVIKTA